ncbi:MAG: nucleotide sugar dehydrogenase, partial [Pseudomonadales bacterium]|nr:nucleotide sugar dehydrogenase [Pseudomonadales bacterium]
MNTLYQTIIDKLNDRTATVGIVGLGYVGLPLCLRFAEVGFKVVGFDIDPEKTKQISAGESYIGHIPAEAIQSAIQRGLTATTDFAMAETCDALILCVPTPLSKHREPDLSFVIDTVESLLPFVKKGQVLSLESTTYPGTTEEELRPRLEKSNLNIGEDYFLVYSPEREDPGNREFTTQAIPKICGGSTRQCLDVGLALYGQIVDRVVPVSSTRVAEMTKLLENIHRAVNIGLVNEMKMVADKMGIDIHEVIAAEATNPFG